MIWLNIEVKTKIGRAHIALLKRLFTSPSGKAIKKVTPIQRSNTYHLRQRDQSSKVMAAVNNAIHAISRKREGSSH